MKIDEQVKEAKINLYRLLLTKGTMTDNEAELGFALCRDKDIQERLGTAVNAEGSRSAYDANIIGVTSHGAPICRHNRQYTICGECWPQTKEYLAEIGRKGGQQPSPHKQYASNAERQKAWRERTKGKSTKKKTRPTQDGTNRPTK